MLNKASGLHVTQQLQPSRHSFSYILYLRQSLCWEEIHVQGLPSAIKSTKRRQPASNDFKERTDLFRQLRLISSRRTVPTMAPVFYRLMMIVILAFLTGQCRGRNPFWFRPTPKRDQQYYQCKCRGQLFLLPGLRTLLSKWLQCVWWAKGYVRPMSYVDFVKIQFLLELD